MSECTPTEADREDAKLFLIGLSLDGTDETPQSLPAEGVDDIVAELAALFAKVRADERAKRPDREQIERTVRAHRVWWNFETGSLCQCGWKCLLSEHPAHVADAVLSSLALKTETDQELQDRIEVLEKNLAYEVAQKIKLAEQLQAATATDLTLEQARWKMHAGIESRCSEEVAAEVKPVIDLVFSSLALEPEARKEKPPVYLASDLWSALRLPDAEFDGYYERNGWADTWSNLLAEVRLRSGARPGCLRPPDETD